MNVTKPKRLLFPFKLHTMLEHMADSPSAPAVSWNPDGLSFVIIDPDRFMRDVVPKYFQQTKFRSFTRQLNLWGFQNLHRREWMHKHFVRGKNEEMHLIRRIGGDNSPLKMKTTSEKSKQVRDGELRDYHHEDTASLSSGDNNNHPFDFESLPLPSKSESRRTAKCDENDRRKTASVFIPEIMWSNSQPIEIVSGVTPIVPPTVSSATQTLQEEEDDALLIMCDMLELEKTFCDGNCRCSFCRPFTNELGPIGEL